MKDEEKSEPTVDSEALQAYADSLTEDEAKVLRDMLVQKCMAYEAPEKKYSMDDMASMDKE